MSIDLTKGQKIDLKKDDGSSYVVISMGLNWECHKGFLGLMNQSIDLDASCVTFDNKFQKLETIFFGNLKSSDKSIQHSGDDRTGQGGYSDTDNETIVVNLDDLPNNVDQIVFTINSYSGETFSKVKNSSARIVDVTTGKEIAKFTLAEGGDCTAKIMCKLYKKLGKWKFAALGHSCEGKTVDQLHSAIIPFL